MRNVLFVLLISANQLIRVIGTHVKIAANGTVIFVQVISYQIVNFFVKIVFNYLIPLINIDI